MRQDPDDFNALKVTDRGRAVLFRGEQVAIRPMPIRNAPARSKGAQASTENPDLFERLRALRKRLADERGVPPYVVFHDATLRQIAAVLPTSLAAFRRIQGVGERKLLDCGEVFVAAVTGYVRETGAQPVAMPAPAPLPLAPRRTAGKLPTTVQETLDLFRAGHNVSAIAERRNLVAVTIENHLADAVAAGEQVDLDRLVSTQKRRAIEAAMAAIGQAALKPIMEHLGPGYTYLELKVVRAALAAADAGTGRGGRTAK
jgi:ATP-dependent DNA helicase RecQ